MSVISEIIEKEFNILKNEVISKYDEKGMRASGDFAESLETIITEEPTGYKAELIGNAYAYQLEQGRLAGKQPPSEVIEKWIVDKGIANQIEGNISISSLAYLIARKIGREGWNRQGYGGVNLISEVITEKRIQEIIDKIGEVYISQFSDKIINEFKLVS